MPCSLPSGDKDATAGDSTIPDLLGAATHHGDHAQGGSVYSFILVLITSTGYSHSNGGSIRQQCLYYSPLTRDRGGSDDELSN